MELGEDICCFDRCGGHLAVDFANTVSGRRSPNPVDRLAGYAELLEFGRQTGTVDEETARTLAARARRSTPNATVVLEEARRLRDALYGLFSTQALCEKPDAKDLAVLNAHASRFRLDENFRWQWIARDDGLDLMLGPIVRAAVELLECGPRDRVRICEADDCGWVFLDTSKNRSRRWCDMAQCGNRAKARRFQARRKRNPDVRAE